jgi:hypothetical protein
MVFYLTGNPTLTPDFQMIKIRIFAGKKKGGHDQAHPA